MTFLRFKNSPVWRYGVAVLSTSVATALTIALQDYLRHGVMPLFFSSVMVSAWYGGLGPGLLASLLSVLASQYFFFPPIHSFAVDSGDDIAQIVVFSIVTVLISALTHAQKRALQALAQSHLRLQEYADAVWDQQRRLAHELHDSLGQELTGMGFLSKSLAQSLEGTEAGRTADKVRGGVERALGQLRGMAKGVMPVERETDGLQCALRDYTEFVAATYGLPCRFECPRPVLVEDHQTASQLYRIAQEAMTNAMKHAKARSVVVTLESSDGQILLRVADDGIGIPDSQALPGRGSGLKIMSYRAAALGAVLRVEKNPPGGTLVTCILPRKP